MTDTTRSQNSNPDNSTTDKSHGDASADAPTAPPEPGPTVADPTGPTPTPTRARASRPRARGAGRAASRTAGSRSRVRPAPEPDGDVVPGTPPVPISVWHIPQEPGTPPVSGALVHRLTMSYTHPGSLVLDLTRQVTPPTPAHVRADLVITQWPPSPQHIARPDRRRSRQRPSFTDAGPDPAEASSADTASGRHQEQATAYLSEHVHGCARQLAVHGCLAVVTADPHTYRLLDDLVTAGHAAGLTYLQHIVVVHVLPTPPNPTASGDPGDSGEVADPTLVRLPGHARHARVHSDVVIFRHPGATHD
jgi:hypothetical protein